MKKFLLISIILFILLFNLTNINANTVCGKVKNSNNFSVSWMNVLIYYSENPSSTINCKVNPENKFCCALEDIKTVDWKKGKLVYAEVFDEDSGYVSKSSNLITSEEGYDLFPEMQIQKAITFNSPIKRILINQSRVFFNLSLAETYNNLNYSLNSSGNFSQRIICENCTNAEFSINLLKGKNTLKLTAYDKREIYEEIDFYSLDYFNVQDSFECPKCIVKGDKVLIPSKTPVKLKIFFNSSHEISGDFLTYFPVDWIINENSLVEDYSSTHNLIKKRISGKSGEIIYSFTSPSVFILRKDFFKYEFSDSIISREVTVYNFFRSFPLSPSKKFSDSIYSQNSLFQKVSPSEPLVINSEYPQLKLIAIYPKSEIEGAFAYLKQNKQKTGKIYESSFNLITNIPSSEIETILFRFQCPKEKILEFYDSSVLIQLEKYDEDENYYYFEANYPKKGNFKIILK